MTSTFVNQDLAAAVNSILQADKTQGDLLTKMKAAQDQLNMVQADDATVGQKLVSAQQQLARFKMIGYCETQINRLPSVQNPDARPVMTWFQPGNTGNTGGGSSAPHGTWAINQRDSYTEFSIQPAGSYNNFFWGLNFYKAEKNMRRFVQVTNFEVPDQHLPNIMAVERNWEQSGGGYRINAGIQALFGVDKDAVTGKQVTNQWRFYDIFAGHWFDTGIPFNRNMFGTGKRVQLVSVFEAGATPADGMHNVSLEVNGTTYQIDKWSKGKSSNWGPYLQTGFQIDSMQNAVPSTVNVYNDEGYWV